LLFQLVKYLSTAQTAARPSHFGCALEFVINAVIRKYTDPQADSKAEKTADADGRSASATRARLAGLG
jgi:hypothetical protein